MALLAFNRIHMDPSKLSFRFPSPLRYYEIELLTYGMVRIGWATKNAPAATIIGMSGSSYAFAPHEVSAGY